MEFENYERELKYLIKKNEKYTSKQFLEFLYENGYKLVESFEKEKHETYYDDNDFSILPNNLKVFYTRQTNVIPKNLMYLNWSLELN